MKTLRLLVAGLLLAPALSRPAAAQFIDLGFTSPTSLYAPGNVYALGAQQVDGKRLISGNFTRINGTPVSNLVRLDAAGALDQPFTQNVGPVGFVYRIISLPNGQYLLASSGGDMSAGGLTRKELLRLNANGTADATFDTGTGPDSGGQGYGYGMDYALQPDGKLLVVGYFDTFNGQPAAGVVRLNANGSVDTSFSVGLGINSNNEGTAVAVQPDGKVLVGGSFDTFNGQPANGLVRLNPDGSLDPTFSSPLNQSDVQTLVVQPDGKILTSGFLRLNNAANPNQGLVRLLPSGSLDTGFNPPAFTRGTVGTGYYGRAMVLQPDGKILVAGSFSAPGANFLTRLLADGSQDTGFQVLAGPSGRPTSFDVQANGNVLVGGFFNSFDGRETSLGQLSSAGAPTAAFAPVLQRPGLVSSMVLQPDGRLVVGGNFTEIDGQAVHRLARLSDTGVVEPGFAAATGVLPGPVTTLALQPDGKVVAGTGANIMRFATSGSPDPGFTTFTNLNATKLALQPDGKLLVAGSFGGTLAGVSYNGLLRLTSTGAFDPTFNRPTTSGASTGRPVYTYSVLVQPDGKVVVAGSFQQSQTVMLGVVRYESTGAVDPTFNFAANSFTYAGSPYGAALPALALQPDGKILAGGRFDNLSGVPRDGVVRLLPSGAVDASFMPNSSLQGTVNTLVVQPNGRILLGGSFTSTGPAGTESNLCRVLANGQADGSFGTAAIPNRAVNTLAVQPDGAIVLAGSFTTVGGQPALGVARIVAQNVLAVSAPAAVAARTAAWPVPAHGLLHVAPDQQAHPLTVELLDALSRPVRSQPATAAPELTLDVAGLPAGLYLLRVNYAAGAVTRRIVVE